MIFPRARNPGMWTAVGAGAGTALGTALGNSPVGLALGAVLGLALAVLAGGPSMRRSANTAPRRAPIRLTR
jgi:hypothetical protein